MLFSAFDLDNDGYVGVDELIEMWRLTVLEWIDFVCCVSVVR